ncbi:PREDICTED: RING finger protein nhl-1-like [Amphimedon queenslandica]|uniref:RING-type domain-containing protein n=1 Tax=Amphimedon queenslandica TaxID=400682 RepID=A0A1X7SW65_AMPQE|nr:PREDICTED: RING finger protein nhl-1-like [Amphimedon queenslandica]|eukprot:XP_011408712.1 PREDICTED: RING finger protein nhl-1-like [Amphimedon queenslandica]
MAGKEVSVPLMKLQEQVTCGKCFNVFTKPKTLSCHHSFCQQCIEGLATIPTFSVACPTCHQHTELPDYAGAAGFSVAPQIVELKQMYDSLSVHVKCDNCANLDVCGYCKECNLSICQQCIDMHKNWSPFADHVIVGSLNDESPIDKAASHVKTILSITKGREAEIRKQAEAVKKEIRSLLKSTIEDKFVKEIDEIVARKLQLLEKQKEESLNASDEIEEFDPIEKADIQFIRSNNDSISHHVGRIVSSAGLEEYKVKEITAIKHIPKDHAISFQLSIESPDDERSLLVLPASSLSFNIIPDTATKLCQVINAKMISTDKPGVYQVIYNPIIRGHHQVHVTALGVQLKSSSFTIPFNPYDEHVAPIRTINGVNRPRGITVSDDGHIIVSESEDDSYIVSVLSKDGKKLKSFGKGTNDITFSSNYGVAISEDGFILVADTDNHRILKISMDGEYVTSVGSKGTGAFQFQCPTSIAVSSIKKHIYVIDRDNCRVQVLNYDLTFCYKFGKLGTGNGEFSNPVDVAIDKEGFVYVTDCNNNRIQKFTNFTHDGNYVCQFGGQGSGPGQLNYPAGITVDTTGLVYVSEYGNHRVSVFTSDGLFLCSFGGRGDGEKRFNAPNFGITFDQDHFLYICDTGNNRIVVY